MQLEFYAKNVDLRAIKSFLLRRKMVKVEIRCARFHPLLPVIVYVQKRVYLSVVIENT